MKTIKIAILGILCAFVLTGGNYMTVQAAPIPASPKVEARAAEYTWRYKVENNILYKRLYNLKDQEWVGDWIECS